MTISTEEKKKIEGILEYYPVIRSRVNELKIDYREHSGLPGLTGIDYRKGLAAPANRDVKSMIENILIEIVEEPTEEEIMEVYLKIKNALSCLNDIQAKVVMNRYFMGRYFVDVAVYCEISTSKAYNVRDEAIRKLKETNLHKIDIEKVKKIVKKTSL